MKWFLFWFVLTSFCLVVLIVILVSWVTRLYFTSLWNLRDTRAATGAFDDGFMCILFFYCIPACWLGFWSYSRYYHIIIFLIVVMGRIWVLTNLYVITTGGHTAKGEKLTAKGLPCAAHGKQHTTNRRRQRGPLSCAIYRAHGKLFAVWFVALGKQILKE